MGKRSWAAATLASAGLLAMTAHAQPLISPVSATGVPCAVGGRVGGAILAEGSVRATSGFYGGEQRSAAGPYAGLSADCGIASFGAGALPFQSWRLSLGPVVDVRVADSLTYRGLGGGVPVLGSGDLTQLDYLGLLKASTPLSPSQSLAFFAGIGGATLWPEGRPLTGGPRLRGSDTALALRAGAELAQRLANGFTVALTATYQRTDGTRFETTLPGERFRYGPNDSFLLGLTLACCDAPPPPPPVEQRVEQPPRPVTPPPIRTPQGSVCGPVVTEKVFATLARIRRDFEGFKAGNSTFRLCDDLYGPLTYNDAWDILGLDPSTSPGFDETDRRGVPFSGSGPQARFNPQTGGWQRTSDGGTFNAWLTGYSNQCAIPRPNDACAATVQFMGTCQHAQVVNYVMWGAINKLCGYPLSNARGAVQARSFFSDDEMRQRQLDMTNIGYTATAADQVRRGFLTTPSQFRQCELKCPVTLPATPWNYIWNGLPGHNKD